MFWYSNFHKWCELETTFSNGSTDIIVKCSRINEQHRSQPGHNPKQWWTHSLLICARVRYTVFTLIKRTGVWGQVLGSRPGSLMWKPFSAHYVVRGVCKRWWGLQCAWRILTCSVCHVSSACQTKLQVQNTQWIIHHLTLSSLVSNCFLFV